MGAVAIVAIVARRRRAMRMLLLVHALRVDHGLLRKGADGRRAASDRGHASDGNSELQGGAQLLNTMR